MDIKQLHQAIKELRTELERVKLAIQRIETIAANVSNTQPAGRDSSGKASESSESRRGKD